MIKSGKWYQIQVCSSCNRMRRSLEFPPCPQCGNTYALLSAGPYKTIILRFTKTSPWWRFWNVTGTYESRHNDHTSKQYIIDQKLND